MKLLLKAGLVASLLACSVYAYLVWNNNRSVPPLEQAHMAAALEQSILWLQENQTELLNHRRAPTLWQFIQQAGELSGDTRLQTLFKSYEERYLTNRSDPWRPLFYPGAWVPIHSDMIASLPYYNRHFLYALTCDKDLGQLPDIAAQNDPDFCDSKRLKPACVTHQLMGIRLLQRIECGDANELNRTVQQLQQRIVRQLILDPRVVDVYIQRALMLAESGAAALIKPVWLRHIIDAQRPDGGWSGFEPLLQIGRHQLSFGPRGFALRPPDSDFHATAQGVLLFSLLTHTP